MSELLSHHDLLGAAAGALFAIGVLRSMLRAKRRRRVIAPPVGKYRTYPIRTPLG